MSDAEMQEEELEVMWEKIRSCFCWCFGFRCWRRSTRATPCTAVRSPPVTATRWESMVRANPLSWRSNGVPPTLPRLLRLSCQGEYYLKGCLCKVFTKVLNLSNKLHIFTFHPFLSEMNPFSLSPTKILVGCFQTSQNNNFLHKYRHKLQLRW